MKRFFVLIEIMLFILFLSTGCGVVKEQTRTKVETVNINVSAASSLRNVAEELKTIFTMQNTDIDITYNFAASGTIQKQIEEGAPVDLFISAGKSQMDALVHKGLIKDASYKNLLGNELVLIAGKDSKLTGFEGLTGKSVTKISIGIPETVPVGQYAKEVLINLKLWDKLQPKLVPAKDVRQVLTYVETGNVEAGLVYRSDALTGKDIKIVAAAAEDSHKPIVYPIAVIKSTKHPKETEEFAGFLFSDEAARVFVKHGFKVVKK